MESKSNARGRLTVFLGYAPGIGKTSSMLAAARRRQVEGMNVIAAWVETHHSPENEALLSWFQIIPALIPNGAIDLDACLASRANLALVDDLARPNPPGSRHQRHFEDVEELLADGMDVYATLDIYQLESLNDIVFQITGYRVPDTLPDSYLDISSDIELVDLPVDELLVRLRHSLVTPPPGLPDAFFRKGNLTALRELALRAAAGQVDGQMREYMQKRDIAGPWPAGERVMVCISSHPLSERLVRTGRRLAESLSAAWYVVYVETPDRLRFSAPHSERLIRTFRLAEELGARVQTISGRTVAEAVNRFARENNISQIVVGKPLRPRWLELMNGSIVDEIIRANPSVDVHVISDPNGPMEKGLRGALRPRSGINRYLQALLLVLAVTVAGVPIHWVINPTNLVMIYLLAVLIAALYLGRGPSMLAAAAGAFAFDFFFTDPRLSLTVDDTQYLVTLAALLGVGLVVSGLTGQVRAQVEALTYRQGRTAALYALSRELAASSGIDGVLHVIISHIGQVLNRQAMVLLPEKDGRPDRQGDPILVIRAASQGFTIDEAEMQAAKWVFTRGQPAGRGTATHGDLRARFQPLQTPQGVIGVLAVSPLDPSHFLTVDQRQLLDAYASLSALAIERAILAEQSAQAQLSIEAEKLQGALLSSISHDLRTPLATVTGVFSSLSEAEQSEPGSTADSSVHMDAETRLELIETGWEEADRLNRLVGNLLDMTRLQSGALKLRKDEGDIEDVIGAALARLKTRLRGNTVRVRLPPSYPMIPMDVTLVEQALVNVIDNAAKYSSPGSQITISARQEGAPGDNGGCALAVSVSDEGPGIPAEDLQRVFEKFYRAKRAGNVAGTGLGLSIARGIVEAHGGRIWAENGADGGAVITFTLPYPIQDDMCDE